MICVSHKTNATTTYWQFVLQDGDETGDARHMEIITTWSTGIGYKRIRY